MSISQDFASDSLETVRKNLTILSFLIIVFKKFGGQFIPDEKVFSMVKPLRASVA